MKLKLPCTVHQSGCLMVLVTGGRCFTQEFPLFDALDQLSALCDLATPLLQMVMLQGGARGADRLARVWAYHNEVRCITEPARWLVHGKAAGPLRNQAMIDKYHPDICIAMPGGNGTADMVARCAAASIPVFTYDGADNE